MKGVFIMNRGITMKRGITTLLTVVILFTSVLSGKQVSAATNNITIKNYVIRLVNALKLDTTNKTYYEVAVENGLLKESEKEKLNKNLSNQFAAVLTDRAEQIMLGDKYKYDKDLYKEIVSKNRISDMKKASNSCRTSIYKMFSKGIMIGFSNGKYKHTRSFKPRTNITLTEAKTVINRLITKSKRKKLSPDGQVIRTTNLPKNYKKYDYILESYPNFFYEYKFRYQLTRYYFKPVELVHYASPVRVFDRMNDPDVFQDGKMIYLDYWMNKVELNLKTRLNVDYRTIDNTWLNNLRSTYFVFNEAKLDKDRTDDIKEYIKKVKKNKIIIKSSVIAIEPSTMYYSNGYWVRVYVKFKVSFAGTKIKQEDLIYGNMIQLYNLKKGKWFDGVYDIKLATKNGRSDGSDYSVSDDSLNDYFFKKK